MHPPSSIRQLFKMPSQPAAVLVLGAVLHATSAQAQPVNLLVNGDFSQGTTGWSGFFNLVDHPTPADDLYVGKPFVNTLLDGGGVRFKGFYDAAGGPNYHYRLAPPRPHISQTVQLASGQYTLSWTDAVTAHGMQGAMAFEVLLDGVQVVSQRFWTDAGPTSSGVKSFSLDMASGGSHTLSFGLSLPGFRTDHVYLQWMDQIVVDNISLQASAVPEAGTLTMMALGLLVLSFTARSRLSRPGQRRLGRG